MNSINNKKTLSNPDRLQISLGISNPKYKITRAVFFVSFTIQNLLTKEIECLISMTISQNNLKQIIGIGDILKNIVEVFKEEKTFLGTQIQF